MEDDCLGSGETPHETSPLQVGLAMPPAKSVLSSHPRELKNTRFSLAEPNKPDHHSH